MEFAFTLAVPRRARLDLYDLSGRRVRALLNVEAPIGETRVRWDGTEENGARVPAGVYFARLDLHGPPAITVRVLRVE
jgi:flagellar hook assembly protein FlgD